jgi:hypothetical protein
VKEEANLDITNMNRGLWTTPSRQVIPHPMPETKPKC